VPFIKSSIGDWRNKSTIKPSADGQPGKAAGQTLTDKARTRASRRAALGVVGVIKESTMPK
jgi:hypothetical protein